MPEMLRAILPALIRCVRSRRELALENLALRQQLAALAARKPRPRLAVHDRLFWVILGDSGPIGDVLLLLCNPRPWLAGIAPDLSCTGNGSRVPTPEPVGNVHRRRCANSSFHGELKMLGYEISERTVQRWNAKGAQEF